MLKYSLSVSVKLTTENSESEQAWNCKLQYWPAEHTLLPHAHISEFEFVPVWSVQSGTANERQPSPRHISPSQVVAFVHTPATQYWFGLHPVLLPHVSPSNMRTASPYVSDSTCEVFTVHALCRATQNCPDSHTLFPQTHLTTPATFPFPFVQGSGTRGLSKQMFEGS